MVQVTGDVIPQCSLIDAEATRTRIYRYVLRTAAGDNKQLPISSDLLAGLVAGSVRGVADDVRSGGVPGELGHGYAELRAQSLNPGICEG